MGSIPESYTLFNMTSRRPYWCTKTKMAAMLGYPKNPVGIKLFQIYVAADHVSGNDLYCLSISYYVHFHALKVF